MTRLALTLCAALCVSGCGTRETIREVLVPVRVPELCVSACPEPTTTPATNGELAEAWAARGEALACYKARQACVREMMGAPTKPTQ